MGKHKKFTIFQMINLLMASMCVFRIKFGKVKDQHELDFHTHGNSQLDKTKT